MTEEINIQVELSVPNQEIIQFLKEKYPKKTIVGSDAPKFTFSGKEYKMNTWKLNIQYNDSIPEDELKDSIKVEIGEVVKSFELIVVYMTRVDTIKTSDGLVTTCIFRGHME